MPIWPRIQDESHTYHILAILERMISKNLISRKENSPETWYNTNSVTSVWDTERHNDMTSQTKWYCMIFENILN